MWDYRDYEDLDSIIFVVNTEATTPGNATVYIPVHSYSSLATVGRAQSGIYIDWGDGEFTDIKVNSAWVSDDWNREQRLHTYAEPGEYTVTLYVTDSTKCSIGREYKTLSPLWAQTLVSIGPKDAPYYRLPKLREDAFDNAFKDCVHLTKIPVSLFTNNTHLTYFKDTFRGCSKITSIPRGTFFGMDKCEKFVGVFAGTGLSYILPINFLGLENVTSLNQAFQDCTKMVQINEGAFAKMTKLYRAQSTFKNCTALTALPSDLFAYNTELVDVLSCFRQCTSLKTIPADLFANNKKLENISQTFSHCIALEEIPADLFKNNPAITAVYYTFSSCDALTTVPEGLFDSLVDLVEVTSAFSYCDNLATISERLFANNTKLMYASSLFSNTAIQTIPDDLFSYCPDLLDVSYTFSSCKKLLSIPSNIFVNNHAIADMQWTFSWLSGITGPAPELWVTHADVKNHTGTFVHSDKLSNWADIPDDWK